MYTKDMIKHKLLTNNAWLLRGFLAIYNNQTLDEQSKGCTSYDNGIGFNAFDAKILSSIAIRIKKGYNLSEKQLNLLRKTMPKYSRQLATIANNHH